jgi:LacI family transcriptional regulator
MADVPRVILLLYPNAGYDRGVLQGVRRYARDHGPWIFYLSGEEPGLSLPEMETDGGARRKAIQAGKGHLRMHVPDFRKWGATGIIGRLQTPEIARMALRSGAPVIAMDLSDDQLAGDSSLAKVSEIRPDSHKAGRLAAEHLLERGFRHFGYLGYGTRTWSERRRQGFCQRLDEAGLPLHVYRPPRSAAAIPWRRERTAIMTWLGGLPKPVGVMTCNDVRGLQALEACTLGRFTVPDEVAVVGVDDDKLLCELSSPSLSSVVFNAEQGGYHASELLDRLMSGRYKKPQRIEIEPLWVAARQSTDVMAVEDQDVAAALRFIRQNAKEPIGVKDVVAKVALSRRALEIRFEHCLGRSIRSEIQRVRLAWTKQLLVETDLSAAKISDVVGFGSLSYLSKVFHRETGETLARYRRNNRPK